LRWISYVIDYQFSGLNPIGYHISSIAFHVLTSILVYFTISTLVKNSRVAFFAALLFAVHPVHTDSVAYISGRRDILSTLFFILGFYLFLESRKRKRFKLLIPSLFSYLLAMASKEMAVTLPAIFFTYDLIFSLPDKGSLAKRLSDALKKVFLNYKIFYLTFLLPAIIFTGYKVLLKSPSNKEGLYGGSLYIQLLTVGKILAYYIKLLFFPVNLIADYSFNSFPLPQSLFEPGILLSLAALCAVFFLILKLLSRNKIMAFSLIWFFVTLLPVCHIFPHHELLAEHYLYLPSFGFVLLIASVFELFLSSSKWKNYISIGFLLLILLFSTRTFYRNYDWKNSFSLWKKTVKTVPNCVRAINNLGVEYYKRRRLGQAEACYKKAISIQPVYEKAYYNLGNVYRNQQNFKQAQEMYQKAAQLHPKNFKALNNLGNAHAVQKHYDEAAEAYRQALKLKPRYAQAHNNLGNVYRSLGKTNSAISHYQKAIRIKPRYPDALCNLGNVYSDLGQYEKSLQAYKSTLQISPNHIRALSALGALYTQRGLYDQAIETFEHTIKINPSSPEPYLNLGNLYLEKKIDKRKALHYLKKWFEKAPRNSSSDSISKKIQRLEIEVGG
jgi:tetratricopeptide (TPR) repeat protein